MVSESEARKAVEIAYPGTKVQASADYRESYLVRVQQDDPDERDFDPFFSVDKRTGAVQEFSILTDGDPSEIATLTWNG